MNGRVALEGRIVEYLDDCHGQLVDPVVIRDGRHFDAPMAPGHTIAMKGARLDRRTAAHCGETIVDH